MSNSTRNSKKRQAVFKAILASEAHPSAEMLYAALKPVWPDLSLGTVYRNLSYFLQSGQIVCVGTVDGHERYDARTEPHSHFICSTCGRIENVELPDLAPGVVYPRVEKMLGGCRVQTHRLTFSGVCAACVRREKRITCCPY